MISLDITNLDFDRQNNALQALYEVIDPELYVNVVDLGLIYSINFSGENLLLEMTLSTPHCPMGESITNGVQNVLEREFPDLKVDVKLVWEPTWGMEMITEEGKRQLGM